MMNKRNLFLLFFVLVLNISCSVSKNMKNTTYYFEPEKFHSLSLERTTPMDLESVYSRGSTELAPGFFYGDIEKVVIVAPEKVTIDTKDIDNMIWEEAKVPICMRYKIGDDSYVRISEHYVFLRDVKTGDIVSTHVELDRYDGVKRRPPVLSQQGGLSGGTFVYNITYFTDLPKYSTEYEVWVKIADLESNHIRIKLDLKERGKLVTELPKKD